MAGAAKELQGWQAHPLTSRPVEAERELLQVGVEVLGRDRAPMRGCATSRLSFSSNGSPSSGAASAPT